MSTIQNLFQQAQLAEAAYADFSAYPNDPIAALQAEGMSLAQATDFVAHWQVVHHLPNTASGFSGTVFRRIDDDPVSGLKAGDLVFAMRGTEGGIDMPGYDDLYQADFNEIVKNGLAFSQIVDMYNYWQQLITPAGELARQATLVPANPLTTPSDKLIVEGLLPPLFWTIELDYSSVGLGKVDLADNLVTTTGHSLGGHLATAFTRLFSGWTTAAITFNGAGYATGAIPGLSLTAQLNIPNLFSMLGGASGFPSADIANIYGDKNLEIVTMDGFFGLQQPGDSRAMFIEQETVTSNIFGHGMKQMADSAAVFDLLVRVDGSLLNASAATVSTRLNPLFEAASPTRDLSLENIVNAMGDLFQAGETITLTDDREQLYKRIAAIKDNANYQLAEQARDFVTLQPLSNLSSSQIATLALAGSAEGLAYRYAIVNLNPFVISGDAALYSPHNANGELELYNPTTGSGALTDQYLKDRAAMLSWQLQFGFNDIQPVGDTYVKAKSGTPFYFEDFTSNAISTKMRVGGGDTVNAVMSRPLGDFNLVVFGSENNDLLTGQGKADHLYGNAGADSLTGNGGNDHLEGGSGFDTYIVNAGDGYDTVLDSDGLGILKLAGIEAKGKTSVTDPAKWIQRGTVWQDQEHGITYGLATLADGSQTLLITDLTGSTVEIKGWSAGELGIDLGAGAAPSAAIPATSLTLTGDLAPLDTDPTTGGVQSDYDALDNLVVSGDAAPNREDTLYDSVGNDHLQGVGGDDTLDAWRGGDNLLEGGAGSDALMSTNGNDLLYGDSQTPVATALASGETQPGTGARGDWLSAGAGTDTLVGAAGNDVLLGGEGEDLLLGGGGNDDIWGDASGTAYSGWALTRSIVETNFTQYKNTHTNSGRTDAAVGAADVIYGGAGDDWIFSNQGNDIIDAGADNDVVFGGQDADVILGQGGDDVLIGNAGFNTPQNDGADYLDGGAGKDELWGGGKNDTLLGGTEDDILIGDGNGTLAADEGEDRLDGGDGDDTLFGNGNNDTLLGGADSDELYGGAGDDTLDGGDGIDYLAGGADNDTYLNVTSDDAIFDTEGTNTIILKTAIGLGAGGLAATEQNGSDGNPYIQLSVTLDDGSALKLDSPFFASGSTTLQFAGGDAFDLETLVSQQLATPIDLQNGDEGGRVYGGAGADILRGGTANDVLVGYAGNDVLIGNAGADTLIGGDGVDVLSGGAGDDTLDGGSGGDLLFGHDGDDTYRLGLAAGGDTISDNQGANTILFGADIVPHSLAVLPNRVGANYDLQLLSGTTALATLKGGLETYRFAFDGGLIMDAATLVGTYSDNAVYLSSAVGGMLWGGRGADRLQGAAEDDALSGGGGNDTLEGGDGNDALNGGAGNDVLIGGAGADTFVFGRTSGHDTLTWQADDGLSDRVRFEAGIQRTDLNFIRTLNRDLLIAINGEDASLMLKGWFDTNQRATQFVFADGTVVNPDELTALDAPLLAGTAGDDVLVGVRFVDHIVGGEGDDTLDGGGSSDVLDGGVGQDVYVLRPGLIGASNGIDTVLEQAGETSLIKLVGSRLTDVTSRQDGNDLVLGILGMTEGLTLKDYYVQPHTWQIADFTGVEQPLADVLSGNETRRAGMDRVARLEEAFASKWQATMAGELLADTKQLEDGRFEHIPSVYFNYSQTQIMPVGGTSNSTDGGWVGATDWIITTLGEQTLSMEQQDSYYRNSPGFQQNYIGAIRQNLSVGNWEVDQSILESASYSAGYQSRLVTLPPGTSGMLVFGNYVFPTSNPNEFRVWEWKNILTSETRRTDLYGFARANSLNPASGALTDGLAIGRLANAGGTLPSVVTLDVERMDQSVMLSTVNGEDGDDVINAWGQFGESYLIHGGVGDDLIRFELGLDASLPVDGLWGKPVPGGFLDGGDGYDLIDGSEGEDILLGGSGNNHLRGWLLSDRYVVSGDGVDLINSQGGRNEVYAGEVPIEWQQGTDIIDLPLDVTPGTLATVFGQAIVGDLVVPTLDLAWNGQVHAKIVLPGADRDHLAANYDPIQVRFADGSLSSLQDLIASTPATENVAYYDQFTRVLLATSATTLSGDGHDNVFVVQGAGVTEVITGAGRNLLQALNPDSTVNLSLASGSETWLGYGYYFNSTVADVVVEGSANAQLHIEVASISSLDNIRLGREGLDLVLYEQNLPGAYDSWNRELRFDNWFAEASPHQVEFSANVYDEDLGLYRTAHISLQAWVDALAAQSGGVFPDGGNVLIGSLEWQSAEVPIAWGVYWPAGLGAPRDYSDFEEMQWQKPIAVVSFYDGMGSMSADEYDAVRFDVSVPQSGLRYLKSGDDLVISTADGSDSLRLTDWYLRTDEPEAWFDSGDSQDYYALSELGVTMVGTGTPNNLTAPDAYGWILRGLGGNDTLQGNAGDDIINGGSGADTMSGMDGDDIYIVDNPGDMVVESTYQGTDRVNASISYALAVNVETLALTGAAVIDGTGNDLDNILIGNEAANTLSGLAGNDTLNGGAGADVLIGGLGDDVYIVDIAEDVITEGLDEGIDQVRSNVTYSLAANLENLVLLGDEAINGSGNELANILLGNGASNILIGGSGNDRLDGKAGADVLLGGSGDDVYLLDNPLDIVTENPDEGFDRVNSSVSYTLSNNVENLALLGIEAIDGTGNSLNNVLIGNEADNRLDGSAGNDTLRGEAGNDTYQLGTGYGRDVIVENDTAAGNTDVAQFLSGVAADQIWFRQVGNNLETSIIGTPDKLVIKDWYLGTAYHVEQFKTTDGAKTLLDSNVANLVNAMASFAPPAAGQTALPTNYQTSLAPVIAANWQ